MRLSDRPHRVDDVVAALLFDGGKIEHDAARVVALGPLARVLAGQEPPCKWAPHHNAHALILDHRHNLALQLAPGDGVIGLHGLEAGETAPLGDPLRLHDLPGRKIGAADRAHQPARDAIVERAHGLLQRGDGIEAVDLVEIDIIELQSFQAAGDLVHDMAARQADGIGTGPGARAHLGGDDEAFARDLEIGERLTEHHFRAALGINIGRVDEIHPRLQRAGDQRGGVGLVELADIAPIAGAAVERHGPEADFRDELAGAAERAIAHEKLAGEKPRG